MTDAPAAPQTDDVAMIPIEQIKVRDGFNPRTDIDTDGLAASVKEQGIIVPLTVSRNDDGYYLVAGERRYTAALEAGLGTVPALIRAERDTEHADAEQLVVALIENFARQDLTPAEEAWGLGRLKELGYTTPKHLATKLGKTQKWVKSRLAILDCPTEVQDLIHKGQLHLTWVDVIAPIARVNAELAVHVLDRAEQSRQHWTPATFRARWDTLIHNGAVVQDNPETGYAEHVGWEVPKFIATGNRLPVEALTESEGVEDEVKAALIKLEEESPYGVEIEFSKSDIDAARAYGCLLEINDEEEDTTFHVIADQEWFLDRLKANIIPRLRKKVNKELKDRAERDVPAQLPKNASVEAEAQATGKSESEIREERKAEREALAENREDAHNFNVEFGKQVFERLNSVELDMKIANMLIALTLNGIASDAARRGLRYMHPGWIEEVELKNGKTKREYVATAADARERLATYCQQAVNAEEALGRLCQVVVACQFADPTCVAQSRRDGSRIRFGENSLPESDAMFDTGIKSLMAKLTPKIRKEAKERAESDENRWS